MTVATTIVHTVQQASHCTYYNVYMMLYLQVAGYNNNNNNNILMDFDAFHEHAHNIISRTLNGTIYALIRDNIFIGNNDIIIYAFVCTVIVVGWFYSKVFVVKQFNNIAVRIQGDSPTSPQLAVIVFPGCLMSPAADIICIYSNSVIWTVLYIIKLWYYYIEIRSLSVNHKIK